MGDFVHCLGAYGLSSMGDVTRPSITHMSPMSHPWGDIWERYGSCHGSDTGSHGQLSFVRVMAT